MIQSLWKIEFITSNGTWLLLDWGDFIPAEIGPQVAQQAESSAAIGAVWGRSLPQGAAMTSLSWSTRREHGSHAALRGFCMRSAAAFPTGQQGTVRVSIHDGEVWEITDASVISSSPLPLVPSPDHRTLTSYSVSGGQMRPLSALTLYPGIPWDWINQDWDSLTTDWDNL